MTEQHDDSATVTESLSVDGNPSVVLPRFGGIEVLDIRDLPRPQALDDEVVVRVAAASVNPVDAKTRGGDYPMVKESDLPIILGRDLAGTIDNCGISAHDMLSHGDRVCAFIGQDRGAQSRYVVVKAVELVGLPPAIDLVTAAAVPLAAMTAWQGIFDHGGLEAGQRVLIHGGAGGVGGFAVQFAAWKGAEVIATAGADDLDYVRGLGASTVIDYRKDRFEEMVGDVDLVFDLIGGDTLERSWSVVRPGGMVVSTVADTAKDAAAHGVRGVERWHAEPNAAKLGQVIDLVAAGTVKVNVAATYPLAEVGAAEKKLADGHVRGKIVLTLD